MVTYLSNYFHIEKIHTTSDEEKITALTGYFTDQLNTMFLPPQTISRQDAIEMIGAGIILFTETRSGYKKMHLLSDLLEL